ncbi:unnamed protein product [Hyaloperonospora brassicae]|uniref:M96 mating-specific protein family n=1 Tax=Hyaloperonospora brassicae TaxID=162125 RepID=A0AAV0T662_HYABA|nr:unnamed protein product [Hyaloperonospora brassicae]
MVLTVGADDDRAFQVTLSFVNEWELEGEEDVGNAVVALKTRAMSPREGTEAMGSSGTDSCVPIGLTTACGASHGYAPAMTCGGDGAHREEKKRTRRRTTTEMQELKKLLRDTGISPNVQWRDSRLELSYLHESVEKLQLELQVLQSRSCRQKVAAGSPRERTGAMKAVQEMPRVWGDVSARQHRRRKGSERENARLRLAVQQQQETAQWMQSLVQKRAGHLMSECSSFMDLNAPKQPFGRMLSSPCDDAGNFSLLFRHLETARREMDAVFASNGLANMVLTPSDVHLRDDVKGKYLEAFSNKVLPFGLRAVAEATWDHFKGGEKHLGNGNIYEKTAKSLEDPYTIMEEFTKEMHSKNARADIKAQQLVRRYMEPGRDIIIWVSVAKPAEIKHKMLRGLTYHLRGYAMTKRSPASTPEHEISQLQCVSLISLEPEAEALHGADTVRAVTNFLIVTAAQKMQAHQDCIENALVDKQLRRRGIITSS